MKILVPIKRVIDHHVHIRINAEQTAVETTHVKMAMNPFDEVAIEAAVRLKEAGIASEIIALTIGQANAEDILRSALAMGADSAVLIETDSATQTLDTLAIAKILAKFTQAEAVPLVLLGKQAIDDDAAQVAPMLAELLARPEVSNISALTVEGEKLTVSQEMTGGKISAQLSLPAVLSVDLTLNEPRFTTLPNIMKAKQKPLQKHAVADWLPAGTVFNQWQTVKIEKATDSRRQIRVNSAAELIEKLKADALL